MARPLVSLAVLFAIAIGAAAALLYVSDRREAQRAMLDQAAVGDQPAVIIQEGSEETTVVESAPGGESEAGGAAPAEQQSAPAPEAGDIAAPSEAEIATGPGERPATATPRSEQPGEQDVAAVESPATPGAPAEAAASSTEPAEQDVGADEPSVAGEAPADETMPSEASEAPSLAAGDTPTVEEPDGAAPLSAEPGEPGVAVAETSEPSRAAEIDAPSNGGEGAAVAESVAPDASTPQIAAADSAAPLPDAAGGEGRIAAGESSEPPATARETVAGAAQEEPIGATEQSAPSQRPLETFPQDQDAAGGPSPDLQPGEAEQNVAATPNSSAGAPSAPTPSADDADPGFETAETEAGREMAAVDQPAGAGEERSDSPPLTSSPDGAAPSEAAAGMPANEDQLALQYPAPTPSLEGSVAEPGSAAHQTEAEPEIAAVGQPAAPAGEPDPSSPGGGAASEAAAGPPSDDAELALQYPAPAPSLEGSVAEPVDADAPAPSAEMTDALEMPRAGEMVAAAPIGDAAVAEAGDVTPEPSIEAAETEGDSLSLSERASGSVEAQDLSIRAAEAEADNLYVAGEAAPGTLVHVYANEELVGEALAGAEGTWLVEAEKDVPIGEIVIRADAVAAGAASPSAQAEAPFMRFPDGVVLEPLATATAEGGDLTASGHMPIPTYALIRRGDNLWRIARRKYGRGIRYEAIFEANSDRIRDPDLIYPGQVFIIPKRDTSWETATN